MGDLTKKKKTIAVFSNYFWTVYNFRKPLILELINKGYRVIAIASKDEYTQRTKDLGCEVLVINNLDPKSTGYIQELKLLWEIICQLRKLDCEYIFTFTIKPNLFATLTSFFTSKKIIITINGRGNFFTGSNPSRLLTTLFKISFSRANKIIFQNKDDYQYFKERNLLNDNKVIFVRGSGVNTSQFNYSAKPAVKGPQLVFLMACRLLKEKGIFEYLFAAEIIKKKYPEVKFRLLGVPAINPSAISPSDVEPFQKKGIIEKLSKTDRINSLLEEIDVLVLPSYYHEGVPKILLEGLSKGLPIITTNWIGCKETVKDEVNGYLVEPKNVDSLVSAIEKMINLSVENRLKMRQESRKLAETEFEEAIVLKAYLGAVA